MTADTAAYLDRLHLALTVLAGKVRPMIQRDALREQLIDHEGLRLKPYTDTSGKLTIGVGRNLTDNGITRREALMLLEHDLDAAVADLATFPWFATLNAVRQRVVVDMRFNLGPTRFRGFKQTLAAIAAGDYQKASDGMLRSKWATQVKGRAHTLAAMMATGLVVLLCVGCATRPPPVVSLPPPPIVVDPPIITPGPAPLTNGGELAYGWLRTADGYKLLAEAGTRYTVRSLTDFLLLKRYCATINQVEADQHIDLDAHLTERISHGATMLRVLGMAHWISSFNPRAVPDYWGCLDQFLDHLGARGLRVSYVVFADANQDGAFPGMMPKVSDQRDHFQGAVEVLARHWNAVGELCNECDKNLTNWRDFPRPKTRTLWSRGSGLGDAPPPLPGWDWFGWHGRRDWPKVWISAEDMWFVTRGLDGNGKQIHPPMVGWADEMIGFAEADQPGRRSNDCDLARTLGYASLAFGSGGTFHSEDGLFSRPLGPRQAACAAAFFEALR